MSVKVGLALSGGGAKGFAHVGVIKSLEKHDVPIDVISGVSAGSIVGGMYASGLSIEEIEKLCYSSGYRDFLKLFFDPARRGGGIIAGRRIDSFIISHVKRKKIESFPIKFGCSTVDLVTGDVFHFKKGDISTAIRASSAVPGVFKPVIYKGRYLVDGGVLEPISLDLVKELGGEVNVGIDLTTYPDLPSKIKKGDKISIRDTIHFSSKIMHKRLADMIFQLNPDVLRIRPNVNKVGIFSLGSERIARRTVKEGKDTMDRNVSKVKEMIENYQKKLDF